MCTSKYEVNTVLPLTASANKGTSSGSYRKVAVKFSMGQPKRIDFPASLGPTKSVATQFLIQRDARELMYFIL